MHIEKRIYRFKLLQLNYKVSIAIFPERPLHEMLNNGVQASSFSKQQCPAPNAIDEGNYNNYISIKDRSSIRFMIVIPRGKNIDKNRNLP